MQKIKFQQLQSPLAAQIKLNGHEYLYFGGTAYLGIPQNQEFLTNYVKGIKYFGLNNGASRGNNVQLGIYDEAEAHAATMFGAHAALITSSGYLAAQLAVKSLYNWGKVSYAPNTHPALWRNEEQANNDKFSDWSTAIVNEINSSDTENWVLISNSMNNLFPEKYDFSFVQKLNKKVLLIVDDSHGVGINNNGKGVFAEIPRTDNVEVLVVASMAKALGVDAGLILGSQKTIDFLKQTPGFFGASPPAAAGLYAFMHSEKIYLQQLNELQNKCSFLANRLAQEGDWHFITNFPVFLAKNAELSNKLLKHDILISSFPYPNSNSEIINRIVLSSWHTAAHINKLAIHL